MTLYSYNGAQPAPLPFRIRLPNGMTRTSLNEASQEDLEALGFVPAPPQPSATAIEKVIWDNGDWSVVPKTEDEIRAELTAMKLAKKSAAGNELATRIRAGHTYGGATYQIDDTAQTRLVSVTVEAVLAKSAGLGASFAIEWRDINNNMVEIVGADAFIDFAKACAARVKTLRAHYWSIVDAIRTADAPTLAAIDVTAGWP